MILPGPAVNSYDNSHLFRSRKIVSLKNMNVVSSLISKYNVPGPRYTSYPTVPFWDATPPSPLIWKEKLRSVFDETNDTDGISIYIHLPFCESLCTYCGCNTRITVNHNVESVYIDALLREWKIYLDIFKNKPRIKEIHLGGGTPTFFSPKSLEKLMKGIADLSLICPDAEFGFEAHPNSTTTEHLEILFNLGFRRLSLGIQDFDPRVQEIVNRIQPIEIVKKVTETAREIGYSSINFDLIYGLPMQKLRSVTDTINKVNLLKPDRIAFYSYAHIPWVKPGQRKFTEMDLPEDSEKRALYETGKKMFLENGYFEIGMDHFALPSDSLFISSENKNLHRNFMGYTPTYTKLLIGLGVSSISDAWGGFAQNTKIIEEYYKLIDKNELPVFKGHILNTEDLILRKHILNLMCRFETSWENEEMKTEFLNNISDRLLEFANDSLIEFSSGHVKIYEKGKPFIRNICMAFDARLWRNQPHTQIFSTTV